MVTRVEEGGGGGGEKERGALSVAGSRRSLHFGTDVTGLLSRSKKACWLAGWLEPRQTGPVSPHSTRRVRTAERRMPICRKPSSRWCVDGMEILKSEAAGIPGEGETFTSPRIDERFRRTSRSVPFCSLRRKPIAPSFSFSSLSLSRFSAFEFPATSVRYVRWEKRWWPSTFHGERGGRDETFEAWELRRSYNPRSFPRNPAETVLVGKIRVRG